MTGVSATERPTSWWLDVLRRRAGKMHEGYSEPDPPVVWQSPGEREAAIRFFNAAFRAEESGLTQAHQLSGAVAQWDPDLAEVLRLYGNEEGWHRELLTAFLERIGGTVLPMGRVTRTFYRLYARAERMETIVLTNLMFETIGATTYRLALRNVENPAVRRMLTILTRDESFHVPLNVHFLRQVLRRSSDENKRRLRRLYRLLFVSLVLLPLASRPKAKAFDRIGTLELARAYAEQLAGLFERERDLDFPPPRLLMLALGVGRRQSAAAASAVATTSIEAAERAADRDAVVIEPL
jgi:hypothetical protein